MADTAPAPSATEEGADFSGIAFCPVCCSNVDVAGAGVQTLDCNNCGQEWSMEISPDRFHTHSMH